MNGHTFPDQQQGAVLLIALVMLLILTLLATTSMRETSLQARISGNVAEQKAALNAAESGLRRGERAIASSSSLNEGQNECSSSAASCVLVAEYGVKFFDYYKNYTSSTWFNSDSLSVDYIASGNAKPFDSFLRWNAAYYAYDPANEVTNAEEKAYGTGPHYYVVTSAAKAGGERFPVILQTVTIRRY